MGFSTPFGNLKGFATSRPPLMVFTLCLTAFALTTLSLAYFINHSDAVPNPDIHSDWTAFLKHLSALDLCVLPDDSTRVTSNLNRTSEEPDTSDSYGNVSIAVTASLSLVEKLYSLPHNVSTISGVLPLAGWGPLCCNEGSPTDGSSLNVTLTLPPNVSQAAQEVCVTFVGPRSLLPDSRSPPACVPSSPAGSVAKLAVRGRGAETLGEQLDDSWCQDGAIMRMSYHSTDLAVILTPHDRSLINLHLLHTSYFLFVMAMTLVCYALIKGKPKQKNILLDKVPLDP